MFSYYRMCSLTIEVEGYGLNAVGAVGNGVWSEVEGYSLNAIACML